MSLREMVDRAARRLPWYLRAWYAVREMVAWAPAIGRLGAIRYAYRAGYGTKAELRAAWRSAPGWGRDKGYAFFDAITERRFDEADTYVCVHGVCSILWWRDQNLGGMGPVGCPCDDLDDPRGDLVARGTTS